MYVELKLILPAQYGVIRFFCEISKELTVLVFKKKNINVRTKLINFFTFSFYIIFYKLLYEVCTFLISD